MRSPVIWSNKENYCPLTRKVSSEVNFEIAQIDQLFEAYAELLERVQHQRPDLVEITAVASVLHSFYSGLENIFLSLAKGVDGHIPSGAQWHRDLLTQMADTIPNRPPILTLETTQNLASYLGFRHFYRHAYSFTLDWDELEKLVIPLAEVWANTKAELERFLNQLGPNF
jgi:hypothetical protein